MNNKLVVNLMTNLINKKFYDTKEEVYAKLDIYFALNRIAEDEYSTLALLTQLTYSHEEMLETE